MKHLTPDQAATIDAAFEILKAITPKKASWVITVSNYHGTPYSDFTYFTVGGEQISTHWSKIGHGSASGRVNTAADAQNAEDADTAGREARRIESLRAELARLTGEVA